MIRSMTGFGEAEKISESLVCRVEIKTVNHRFFNANFRMPSNIGRLEADIKKALQEVITRGHVHYLLSIKVSDSATGSNPSVLDLEKAKVHWEALNILKKELGIKEEIGLSHILGESFSRDNESASSENISKNDILDLTKEALEQLTAFRVHEGLNIEQDLKERLVILTGLLKDIDKRAPERLIIERDRLQRSIQELVGGDLVDQDRVAREVAIIADKWDISEEIVRLQSHLELFSLTLSGSGSQATGKKLGFILQEILREINTVSAKANDSVIGKSSIEFKEELERIREQLENVE